VSLDLLGCDEIGFDYGSLLSAAAGLAEGGITMYKQSESEAKTSADATKAAGKATQADLDAASAIAKADVSAQLHSKSAASDKTAATAALALVVSTPPSQQRIDDAKKMQAKAQTDSKASPADGYKKAYASAWGAVIDAITGGGPAGGGDKKSKDKGDKESWLTRRVIGPIPGYGVLVGGAGILGIIGLIVKRLVRK
jgi:hypothetical protein